MKERLELLRTIHPESRVMRGSGAGIGAKILRAAMRMNQEQFRRRITLSRRLKRYCSSSLAIRSESNELSPDSFRSIRFLFRIHIHRDDNG
jgi:hypothetical protein